MWIVADEEPICDECEEARQPLLAEIDRLKAELAKFHECDETSACHDDEGMIHTLRATPGVSLSEPLRVRKVYHKTGE
jgi:hypothetical protein